MIHGPNMQISLNYNYYYDYYYYHYVLPHVILKKIVSLNTIYIKICFNSGYCSRLKGYERTVIMKAEAWNCVPVPAQGSSVSAVSLNVLLEAFLQILFF